jgi:hypothetical protein
MLAWPSSSWMTRRSAPPSSRWVAKEWRNAWGWACTSAGASRDARRDQVRSRRRTSEVDRRRPVLDRNSAPGSRPTGASAGRPLASQRSSARAACSPTGGVGELDQRPVPERQRAGGGDAIQQHRDLGGLENPRKRLGTLGGAEQVGGILLTLTERHLHAEQAAQRGELARDRRRGESALGQRRDVAAQRPDVDRRGLQTARRCPAGQLLGVERVGDARTRRDGAG